jgi:FtsH-binding integral membrane protein
MDKSMWVIVSVSLLTGIVAFWRGERLLAWYPAPVKGVAGRIVIALVFTIAAAIFGLVANSVYGRVAARRPDTAPQIYLWVGVGLAILLTIAGFIVPTALKKQGPVIAWTMMNLLWGVGYGWVLPWLRRS